MGLWIPTTASTRITDAAAEPITEALVQTQGVLPATLTAAETTWLAIIMAGVRQAAEDYTGLAFITQTWEYALDVAPETDYLELPVWPLQSTSFAITYFNSDNITESTATGTFASTNYFVDTRANRVVLVSGASWPSGLRAHRALVVSYKAGYGDAAANVPAGIRRALLLASADAWEHRGGQIVGTIGSELPINARRLLSPYRRIKGRV